jgi:radical S-adenosyl methionine domain-containing protein 2
MRIHETEELVINWHLTEACNFRCRYCFASWERGHPSAELWRDISATRVLLEGLRGFFDPANASNPLRSGLRWRSVRLSLAGGEPTLLGSRLTDIAALARSLGLKVSLITNGSRPDVVEATAPHLDMIGISLDSADERTNAAIGRACRTGMRVSADKVMEMVARAREGRPDMIVKVNTVVSAANAGEDMSGLIGSIRPDRWKVMRVLPVLTDALPVDAEAFRAFVDRHRPLRGLMTVEDNADMERSYVMVDPAGRFFQNGTGNRGYRYSRPIPEVGVEAAFAEVPFRSEGFAARYPTVGAAP